MPKVCYVSKKFSADRMAIIDKANEIVEEYNAQGFSLTLRQIYYKFVSQAFIANTQKEYKRLGDILNDARVAGLVDWNAIVDRTRKLRELSHWDTPSSIIKACASQYRIDKWADQPHRFEILVEKDALVGILEGVCNELDVPYFSCRGYTSQSELWLMAQRLKEHNNRGQVPIVIHLADMDPSGVDMSRDIKDRLAMFSGLAIETRRIALNEDQIQQYNPPPNPAKLTDSRATAYIERFGSESWELDALEPRVIVDLIRETVESYRDDDLWDVAVKEENKQRDQLQQVSKKWTSIIEEL